MRWCISVLTLLLATMTLVSAQTLTFGGIYYDVPSNLVGTKITAHVIILSPSSLETKFMFEIVKDNTLAPDEVLDRIVKDVSLSAGRNDVSLSFIAPGIGNFYLRVYYFDEGKWIRLDPWTLSGAGRPGFRILADNPPVEDERTITSLPYTIIDTITYRIRYDTPNGGPVYSDIYYLDLKAGQKINITVESLNGMKFTIFYKKDDGSFSYATGKTYYQTTYTPSKAYTMEIRIYCDGKVEGVDKTKYKLSIEEVLPPAAWVSVDSVIGYAIGGLAVLTALYYAIRRT